MTTTPTTSDLQQSFFVCVRDINTGIISYVAVPSPFQVGRTALPAEFIATGRITLAQQNYFATAGLGSISLNTQDTLSSIFIVPFVSSSVPIFLPTTDRVGTLRYIKDASGTASTSNLVVSDPSGATIDGQPLLVISTNNASVGMFLGTQGWETIVSSGGGGGSVTIEGEGGTTVTSVGSTYTVSSSIGADKYAHYVVVSGSINDPNARTLTAGSGVSLVDGGPGSTLTVTATSTGGATNLVGLSTARPSPTDSGDTYWCTDIPVAYVDNGSWQGFATKGYLHGAGQVSNWVTSSNLNLVQRGDTILSYYQYDTEYAASLQAIPTGLSGSTWQVRVAGNITYTIGGQFYAVIANGTVAGSSTCWGTGPYYTDGGGIVYYDKFTLEGSRIAQASAPIPMYYGGGIVRNRWICDGVNVYSQYSSDGSVWAEAEGFYGGMTLPTGPLYFGWSNGFIEGETNQMIASVQECVCLAVPTLVITDAVHITGWNQITTSTPHGMPNGASLSIQGIVTSVGTPPNGYYGGAGNSTMVVQGPYTFSVSDEYTSGFTYLSGGYVTRLDI